MKKNTKMSISIVAIIVLIAAVFITGCVERPPVEPPVVYHIRPPDLRENPEAGWNYLLVGNARFRNDTQVTRDWDAIRERHAAGQWPFVSFVSCSDSRFAPEVIFDQGIGDVFVVRTAGNIVDSIALGSLEFSVHALGTPLIVVLGHEGCGAVYSTVDAVKGVFVPPPGLVPVELLSVVDEIKPAAKAAIATNKTGIELREYAAIVNVHVVAAEIVRDGSRIREEIRAGNVIVIGAKSMFDGTVNELFRIDARNVDAFVAKYEHMIVRG